MSQSLNLRQHYREKYYTITGCIEREFPNLRKDPDIKVALRQIRNAERVIEDRVREMQAQEPEDLDGV